MSEMTGTQYAMFLVENKFVLIINEGPQRRIAARFPKFVPPRKALFNAHMEDLVLARALTKENKVAELAKVQTWVDGMTDAEVRMTYLHDFSPVALRREIRNDYVYEMFLAKGGETMLRE
jgi:hypothetical protein